MKTKEELTEEKKSLETTIKHLEKEMDRINKEINNNKMLDLLKAAKKFLGKCYKRDYFNETVKYCKIVEINQENFHVVFVIDNVTIKFNKVEIHLEKSVTKINYFGDAQFMYYTEITPEEFEKVKEICVDLQKLSKEKLSFVLE